MNRRNVLINFLKLSALQCLSFGVIAGIKNKKLDAVELSGKKTLNTYYLPENPELYEVLNLDLNTATCVVSKRSLINNAKELIVPNKKTVALQYLGDQFGWSIV